MASGGLPLVYSVRACVRATMAASAASLRKKGGQSAETSGENNAMDALTAVVTRMEARIESMQTQMEDKVGKLDDKVGGLQTKVDELTTTLTTEREEHRREVEDLKLQLAQAQAKADFATNEQLDGNERNARACNVIFRDFKPEGNEQVQTQVVKCLKAAGGDELQHVADSVEQVIVLSPSVIKVVFKNRETRNKVFSKRRDIRTKGVKVQEDLTKLQQANVRRLQPAFEVLLAKARAEQGRWFPFFRGGLLHQHVGPVVQGQPQRAEVHASNWDPTVLAACIHERTLAAAGQQASQQG